MIYCMIVIGMVGLMLPIWLDRKLKELLRVMKHPERKEHPLTKTMIQKYSICYRMKKNVNNVDSFVDKYVYSYKIGGLYLSTWDRLCGQLSGGLLLISIAQLVGWYMQKSGQLGGQPVELSTVGIGVLVAGLLIFYNSLFGRKEKLWRFCYEMKDYLENVLQPKLEQERMQAERIPGVSGDHTQAEALIRAVQERKNEKQPKTDARILSERQQDIIDEILLEYLP